MTTDADDIRRISDEAISRKEVEDRQRKLREQQSKEARRLAVMSRAAELFEAILVEITKLANKGSKSHNHNYNADYEKDRWQAEAIADEAKGRGFKVRFKSQEANMGDSSAPGWTTFYWLEISW